VAQIQNVTRVYWCTEIAWITGIGCLIGIHQRHKLPLMLRRIKRNPNLIGRRVRVANGESRTYIHA